MISKSVILFSVCFGDTSGGTQGLLLVLNSVLIPDMLRGPYVIPEFEPSLAACKLNALLTVLSSSPKNIISDGRQHL